MWTSPEITLYYLGASPSDHSSFFVVCDTLPTGPNESWCVLYVKSLKVFTNSFVVSPTLDIVSLPPFW